MKVNEVKDLFYSLVSKFYKGATVIWADQVITRPPLPYLTVKAKDLKRDAFFSLDADGVPYYNATLPFEINLYTKGRKITSQDSTFSNMINTATEDLTGFFSYLDSQEGLIDSLGINISLIESIRDLTELQNEKHRFRAMAEANISFALECDGAFGVLNSEIESGVDETMKSTERDLIEDVDLEGGTYEE